MENNELYNNGETNLEVVDAEFEIKETNESTINVEEITNQLNTLVESAKKSTIITQQMYDDANQLIQTPIETYTLEQYVTLLYVIGGFKEQEAITTYCGIRINSVLNKQFYRVVQEDEVELDEKIITYNNRIQEKVNSVLKQIDKRFMNVNTLLVVIFFAILIFMFKQNWIISLVTVSIMFVVTWKFTLPRSKERFINDQTLRLRNMLPEHLKSFEEEMY